MAPLPRVVTVDPTGILGRIVRAALDLTDHSVIQIDVRGGAEALDEINRTGCQLLVTTFQLHDDGNGVDLALYVKENTPQTAVIVLSDADDPEQLDENVRTQASFVYLHRPVDPAQFMRVLATGLNGGDIFAANAPPVRTIELDTDLGPIPPLDLRAAQHVIDSLLTDVGAMAIVLANRAGEIMLERGAVGYLDRERLTGALLPTMRTTVEMGSLVGGQTAALQFYDGDTYDVFVLSVGFHHFMCLVYDGQIGSRQFGAVNRFGRRAAEDLITLLGMSAFAITEPAASSRRAKAQTQEVLIEEPIEPLIERAEEWAGVADEPTPMPEPEPVRLDPIEDLDLSLFDKKALEKIDISEADDLFDPDKLAEIASETRRERGPLSYDEARELGIIP
jgi:DNA-binding NarL/FixJ family response regulator